MSLTSYRAAPPRDWIVRMLQCSDVLQADSAATSRVFVCVFAILMKRHRPCCLSLLAALSAVHAEDPNKPSPIGYEDTPIIPGTEWRVHDIKRPAPPVITPGKSRGMRLQTR